MRRWQCFLLVAWICLSVGCTGLTSKHTSGTSSQLQGTTPQIRGRLLSQIPLGTPRADAKRIAISLGLEPTTGKLDQLPDDNTLHFQKEGKQWWGGRKISLIQIDCPDGVVEDIFCEQIGVGW
jgi:hypothetical protein